MSAEENKALVTRAITAMHAGDSMVIDDVYADNYTMVPLWPHAVVPQAMAATRGRERIKAGVQMMRSAMPDVTQTIDLMVAEGDTVVACVTLRGTHTGGPLFDHPAKGTAVQWTSVDIFRIAGGKIVEVRQLWDRLGAFQQMGIVPSQAELHQQAKVIVP